LLYKEYRVINIIARPAHIIPEKLLFPAENFPQSQYMEVSHGRALYWFISGAPIGGTGNNKNVQNNIRTSLQRWIS
jgi:hypothetical protein